MELQLHPLKFETTYNNKTYIIEAYDYYNGTDETKWRVKTSDSKCLDKYYNLVDCCEIEDIDNSVFDTKCEAVEALKTYLLIQDRIDIATEKYKEKIKLLESKAGLIYSLDSFGWQDEDFLDLNIITNELIKECPFIVNKSCNNRLGVQVTIDKIRWIFLLEEAISKIEKKYDCKLINYFDKNWTHFDYSPPLYYYFWDGGNCYVRHFAFVRNNIK